MRANVMQRECLSYGIVPLQICFFRTLTSRLPPFCCRQCSAGPLEAFIKSTGRWMVRAGPSIEGLLGEF